MKTAYFLRRCSIFTSRLVSGVFFQFLGFFLIVGSTIVKRHVREIQSSFLDRCLGIFAHMIRTNSSECQKCLRANFFHHANERFVSAMLSFRKKRQILKFFCYDVRPHPVFSSIFSSNSSMLVAINFASGGLSLSKIPKFTTSESWISRTILSSVLRVLSYLKTIIGALSALSSY